MPGWNPSCTSESLLWCYWCVVQNKQSSGVRESFCDADRWNNDARTIQCGAIRGTAGTGYMDVALCSYEEYRVSDLVAI